VISSKKSSSLDLRCACFQTTNLLLERLRAWKHMCGYLEDYFSATAKVQKSQSKDYEKILKVSGYFYGSDNRD
jgi:hypothetical protein